MATTGTNIITSRVRYLLNDTATAPNSQRWSDALFLLFLNDGVQMIIEMRPDAKLASDGTMLTITELSAIANSISIADKWRIPLVHYICARAFECPGAERYNLDASDHHENLFLKYVSTL